MFVGQRRLGLAETVMAADFHSFADLGCDDRLVEMFKADVEELRGFKSHPPHTPLHVREVYMLVLLFSRVIKG